MKRTFQNFAATLILIVIVQVITKSTDAFAASNITTQKVTTEGTLTTINIEIVNPSCAGKNDGVANLTINGNDLPYTILWSNGEMTEDVHGLAAGNYALQVIGASGEKLYGSFTLKNPMPLTVAAVTNDVTCYQGNNGNIEINVSGGTGNFTYYCNGQPAEKVVTGLSAGNYQINVTDATGCAVVTEARVNAPEELPTFSTIDITCNGKNNGAVVFAGTKLKDIDLLHYETGNKLKSLSGLAPGTYNATITQMDGCIADIAFAIAEPAPFSVEVTAFPANCEQDGSAIAVATGGIEPYDYLWSDNSEIANLDALNPGEYSVTVKDANGCKTTGSITVGGVSARISLLLTSVAAGCNAGDDGSIDLYVSGGVEPYQYLWSNGNISEDLFLVGQGNYVVTVTDANGCSQSSSIEVASPSPMTAFFSEFTSNCEQQGISVIVAGGSGSYTYRWSNGSKHASCFPESSGIYTVDVTDESGCSAQFSTSFETAAPLSLEGLLTIPSGSDKADGAITVNISGGTAPYLSEWDNGLNNLALDNLSPGVYSLSVTDAKGCSVTESFSLELGTGEESFSEATHSYNSRIPFQAQIQKSNNGGEPSTLYLQSLAAGRYDVELMDITGRKVGSPVSFNAMEGDQHTLQLNTINLKTGVYLVKVATSGLAQTVKFYIVN